jgi:hypothetical protein
MRRGRKERKSAKFRSRKRSKSKTRISVSRQKSRNKGSYSLYDDTSDRVPRIGDSVSVFEKQLKKE